MSHLRRPTSYGEVRRRLTERGYLDGRIERFVLGARLAPLKVALRAALIGGAVMGALLAGAAATANRPLFGPADLALLWCYFGVLAAVALFVLNLGVAALVGLAARRRGARAKDVLAAALVVAFPTLVYLLLLWWQQQDSRGAIADLTFLASAVAVTLLVAWLAGLVSLAGVIGRTGQVPDRRRRPVLVLVLALLPLALGALGLRSWLDRAGARVEPAPFTVTRNAPRLLLLGVDGLDGELVQELAPRGAVEALLEAAERGATFPLTRRVPAEPPAVWTTLLTGAPIAAHGVESVGASQLPGIATPLSPRAGPIPLLAALKFLLPVRIVPSSATGRRVRTLWEIVALRQPSLAVGFWASWPAVPHPGGARGYVVTDRVLPKLLSGRPADRDTLPASLFDRLRNDFDSDRDAVRDAFAATFPERLEAELSRWAWESYLIDAYSWRVTERLLADPEVRAAFVYWPGLDILRQRVERRGVPAQQLLEGYVRALDALVERAFESGAGGHVVLVADPGRGARDGDEGFVLVSGPEARAGCVGPRLDVLDVTPLALGLLGFPRASEMAGRSPASCLSPESGQTGAIATYGQPPVEADAPFSDYDPEMVERLRSLGYIN